MELFTQSTLPQSTRKADGKLYISVARGGQICILSEIARRLALNPHDKVGFAIHDGQLYIIPRHADGFVLRTNKTNGPLNLLFSHSYLCGKIIKMIPVKIREANPDSSTFRMVVGQEKQMLPGRNGEELEGYPVFTVSATYTVYKQKKKP